jgi:hypothetical protein
MMKTSLMNAHYLLVIPAMILILAAHYSRALRWKILMEPLGFQPSNVNTFIAVMLSYFFNLLVPRLGEVMKCTILARYEKTPVGQADRYYGGRTCLRRNLFIAGHFYHHHFADQYCWRVRIGRT